MKILSIGNSYSQDSTRYLHQIAKSDGEEIKVVNLYIGGCSLATHYKNINSDNRSYEFEINGIPTRIFVSIREALQSDEWDYVTMQQVSNMGKDYDSFNPYIKALSDYVSFHAPKAKQLLHQTWGYGTEDDRLKGMGYRTSSEMFEKIKETYFKVYEDINAKGILPSGATVNLMHKNGADNIYRDIYSHMSFGLGRFATGLCWYGLLTGKDVLNITYSDFDEAVSDEDYVIAKQAAAAAAKEYKKYIR